MLIDQFLCYMAQSFYYVLQNGENKKHFSNTKSFKLFLSLDESYKAKTMQQLGI